MDRGIALIDQTGLMLFAMGVVDVEENNYDVIDQLFDPEELHAVSACELVDPIRNGICASQEPLERNILMECLEACRLFPNAFIMSVTTPSH